jgi:hypothetical protein
MAQDSFDAIVNAVMLAESGGRRFDKQGNLLTSSKGAQGEMQVMPGTAKSPGYGVAPAQDRSPEELARVGRDYLKSMLDKYGELDKALAAYNWGPGNTDKWIAAGADPKKLPSETRSYIDKIKSTLGGERVADRSSKPAASPAPAPAQRPPTARGGPLAFPVQRTADLGTSYQAALALSFLADEAEREEKGREYDERGPSVAQQWLASSSRKVSPEMLAMPYASPFGPEPEPVRAADGGFIAVGYDTPSAYKDGGSVSDEEWKDGPPPPEVPRGLSGAIFGAATMEDAPRGPRTARERLMQMYHSARDFVEDVPRTPLGMATEGAMFLADRYKLMPPALQELMAQEKARRDSLRALRHARGYADGGEAKRRKIPDPSLANFSLWAETVSRDMYPARDDNVKRDAARHMLASAYLAHRTSPGFAEGMGKAYEFKEAPFKTLGHWMGVSAPRSDYSTDTRNNALGASMAELAKNPDALRNAVRASIERGEASLTPDEISSMGYNDTVYDPKKSEPVKKAEGGEAKSEDKASARGMLESLKSGEGAQAFLRGLTMLPQNIVGAPVDVATLVMRPFGYNVERPVGGSEWLKEKSRAAGVAFQEPTDPNARALYTAGDIASNLINPAGATRAAVRGVKEVGEQAGQAAKMLRDLKPPSGPDLAPAGVPAEMAKAPDRKSLEELVSAPMLAEGSKRDFLRLEQAARQQVIAGEPVTAIPKARLMEFTEPVMDVGRGMKWYKLNDPRAAILEGGAMNHSIGQYAEDRGYVVGGLPAFLSGRAEVYSLRGEDGVPRVTLSIEKFQNGDRFIRDVRGPSNSNPAAFRMAVLKFMDDPKNRVIGSEYLTYNQNQMGQKVPPVNIDWKQDLDDWRLGILDYRRGLKED